MISWTSTLTLPGVRIWGSFDDSLTVIHPFRPVLSPNNQRFVEVEVPQALLQRISSSLSESECLDSFIALQLDIFYAIWESYYPSS